MPGITPPLKGVRSITGAVSKGLWDPSRRPQLAGKWGLWFSSLFHSFVWADFHYVLAWDLASRGIPFPQGVCWSTSGKRRQCSLSICWPCGKSQCINTCSSGSERQGHLSCYPHIWLLGRWFDSSGTGPNSGAGKWRWDTFQIFKNHTLQRTFCRVTWVACISHGHCLRHLDCGTTHRRWTIYS